MASPRVCGLRLNLKKWLKVVLVRKSLNEIIIKLVINLLPGPEVPKSRSRGSHSRFSGPDFPNPGLVFPKSPDRAYSDIQIITKVPNLDPETPRSRGPDSRLPGFEAPSSGPEAPRSRMSRYPGTKVPSPDPEAPRSRKAGTCPRGLCVKVRMDICYSKRDRKIA